MAVRFKFGNMWHEIRCARMFLITTNSYIRKDGCLVMGRGIAKQAAERMPGLPKAAGDAVKRWGGGHLSEYGLLMSQSWPENNLGLFQVKRRYDKPAELYLIQLSARMLAAFMRKNKVPLANLNFPGIGNGRLRQDEVLDILLPELEGSDITVNLWQHEIKRSWEIKSKSKLLLASDVGNA